MGITMLRSCLIALLLLAGLASFAATTVVVNGKTVAVPMIEQKGKAYVDAVALMKLLGGSANYDAKAHKVVISSTAPAPKPATPAMPAASAGAQLAGDNGQLGTVYSIVKSNPIHFTLKSAAFTTKQVTISDYTYLPKADEKLLLLNFSVQNPSSQTEQFVRYDSLRFTAVDAMNVNHEFIQNWGDAESHNSVGLNLKPKQKIEVYTAIIVPAKGTVPKLMVLPPSEGDGPVLRYDLRGNIAGLTAPIADPADPTGATALETVPAAVGAAYPYAEFDMTVEGFSYSNKPLEDEEMEEGQRYLFVTLLMKNKSAAASFLRSDTITPLITDTDGAELHYRDMFFATGNRSIGQDLKAGAEMRVRLVIDVPAGSTPAKLALKEDERRTYEFEIK